MSVAETRTEGRAIVERLVVAFRSNLAYYKSSAYTETATRTQFIDPLLRALGWDVGDQAGAGPRREVLVENVQREAADFTGEDEWDDDLSEEELAERTPVVSFPDYLHRVDMENRFVVEAKKPSINLRRKAPSFQAKSYAWSMRLPIAVLTDFEELRVFDARYRPEYERPDMGVIGDLDLRYDGYLDAWPQLWDLLSREAVVGGSLSEFVSRTSSRGTQPVDRAFLAELADWRLLVAGDLKERNPDLDRWEIAEATQRILDRVVFLRTLEDRGVLADTVLRRYARRPDAYQRLVGEFRRLDDVYNGQLFAEHFSERLDLSDRVFQRLVEALYYPRCPYRFDAIGVDLLGSIYERFLGQEIVVNARGQVEAEDKPEVRHAGGVYYTPRWIVERIVASTIGPLVEGKTPRGIANLRIVDPACGSGAFLLGAFEYLVRWHENYYGDHPDETPDRHFVTAKGERRLTSDAKANILANNIYGVDIDPQAVEVTQMSLYMAVLEGESAASLAAQQRLFEQAYLPRLDRNIRCGNSLLSPADLDEGVLFGEEELRRRVNPFDWHDNRLGFGQVFLSRHGFDAVIGNPPYTRVQVLRRYRADEASAYQRKYAAASEGSFDISFAFVERGLELLRPGDGRLGFIVTRQIAETSAGAALRRLLSARQHVAEIVDFGDGLVFEGVGAYTMLLLLTEARSRTFRLTRVPPPPTRDALNGAIAPGSLFTAEVPSRVLGESEWSLSLPAEESLLQRLAKEFSPLGDLCNDVVFQGVTTGGDYVYRLRDLGPDPRDGALRRVARRDDGTATVIEQTLLRPVLAGRSDIRRFSVKPASEVLLLPYERDLRDRFVLMPEEVLRRDYPQAWAWLESNRVALMRRSGHWDDRNWWAYSARKNMERFEEPKVLIPYMVDQLCAFNDINSHYFVNVSTGGYGIPASNVEDPAYLAALLNSRLLSWVLRRYSRAFRGGWFAARKGNLVKLPIAPADVANRRDIVALYDRCTEANDALRTARTDRAVDLAERALAEAATRFDRAVEALYGLSEEEVALLCTALTDEAR